MSEIDDFLESYQETLRQEIAASAVPPELTERFVFESCVKKQDDKAVYFVIQKSDDRRAVLRVTSAGSGENAAAEGTILARLNHPAIPKVLGVWESNGQTYLVREYFEGDDLNAYIRKHGTLSREQLLDTVLFLCDVLDFIHSQSPAIIHRDIKPENIILSGTHGVRLIDFGIARGVSPEAEKDTLVAGTRPYMAPEQFGSEQTDCRADLYSLGVVMIFMGIGRPDKQGLKNSYPYKDLLPVIEKCIRKDRDGRFRSAARLKRKILWIRRRLNARILFGVGVCLAVLAAFFAGRHFGESTGFARGVDSILDVPTDDNRPFTPEELNEPVTFDSWYLDMAVRTLLNKQPEDTIYRIEVTSRVGELRIYGTYILHPSLETNLQKTHQGKGSVSYLTDDGFWIDARGDIRSLADIPNMYYLKSLTLTSQSIDDLSPLAGMKLEKLNLSDNFVGNLLPLKDIVTLRELDVCQNPLGDLTPISRLLSLESLDISQTQVTDLAPLSKLTKIQTLKLNFCDIEDIRVLEKLPALREVDLGNTPITDLTPLLGRKNPITIHCAGLPQDVVDKVRGRDDVIVVE